MTAKTIGGAPARPAKLLCVAGARPNFMKIAPLMEAFAAVAHFVPRLVHTGQHYDDRLSGVFFEDLGIPRPDVELGVGSGSHAAQTAEIMRSFEPVMAAEQPQAVVVVGDVNSTIACALVASKFVLDSAFRTGNGLRRRPIVVHVEAGLRSFDDEMPEEINRKLTDAISDLLFVSDRSGVENLRREGVDDARIFYVGNVMIDTLLATRERAQRSDVLERLGLAARTYGLVTLHRPSNVDDPEAFRSLLDVLDEVAGMTPLVFPVHPRTRARLAALGRILDSGRWTLTDPVGYLDFLKLVSDSRLVLTDSGGIQEETTVLEIPCVTLRESTERPVTIAEGTNLLAGTSREGILDAVQQALSMAPSGRRPELWDGRSARRIADIMTRVLPPS